MKEPLVLAGVGLLFVLGALGALVGFVLTEPILTLDGLMVLAVCLLLAGVFAWFSLSMVKEAGAGPKGSGKQGAPGGGEKTP